jgi:hypothetical protein
MKRISLLRFYKTSVGLNLIMLEVVTGNVHSLFPFEI